MKIHETSAFIIEGHVSAGYERVKDLFKKKYELGCEENSQLCVYVDGEKVIDLWGRLDKSNGYNGDSLTTVYSNTKTLTAIMMAIAVDKGWIQYQDKIAKHWPEFGQNGKENITIEDLMKHEGGLNIPNYPLEEDDFLCQNVKNNKVGDKLARMKPSWPDDPAERRKYHANSRGWIANEIFRRVHPEGLTLGEFLQKNIASVFDVDTYISCEKKNFYACRELTNKYIWTQGLKNTLGLESGIIPNLSLLWTMKPIAKAIEDEIHPSKQVKEFTDLLYFCKPQARIGEHPSAGGNCSARGMAKLASVMANKGCSKDGKVLMSESAWSKMHDNATELNLFGAPSSFTQGGIACVPDGDKPGYFGWNGYGGSCFQWHPTLKIGFAYTCTLLYPFITLNAKSDEFKALVVECVKKLNE